MKRLPTRFVTGLLRRISGTITHVCTDQSAVALTFDDGPDPSTTPVLLEILNAHGAKATFFMTGANAAAYPEVASAVHSAGHAIGNHSWDHPSFPLVTRHERLRQLRKCSAVLPESGTHMFRPPYGHQTAISQIEAWLTGHQVVTWNVCVPDWEEHDAAWLADFALQRVRSGSVILMHDGLVDYRGDKPADRRPTLEAVDIILAALSTQYRFVTVTELLQKGKPVRVNWWMRPDVDFLNQLKRNTGQARRYNKPQDSNHWFKYNS